MKGEVSQGEQWKRQGDISFSKGDFLAAVAAFTRCLTLSDSGDPERAQAFSSRSAVLMAVGHFRDAVRDVERALQGSYPEAMRFRLHLRMAICFKELGEMEKACEQMEKTKELIASRYDIPGENLEEMISIANKKFTESCDVKFPMVKFEYLEPPSLSFGEHTDYPDLSSAVTVEKDDYFGRKVVAARNLETGDVILVENPAVTNLKNDSQWLHCSGCYKLSLCLMPCEKCKQVLFCSDECEKQALQLGHQLVCPALNRYQTLKSTLNLSDNMSANLTRIFDLVASFGIDGLLAFKEEDIASKSVLGRFFDLCHHSSDQEKQIKTICAIVIGHCFQLSEPDAMSKLSELSCRMLLIDKSNSYSIEQSLLLPQVQGEGDQLVVHHVAYGTYPSASLLNHSCDPNVVDSFHLKSMVLRATRPIAKGEQLCNRYCNSFYNMPRDMRRARLHNYNFECGCEACSENWPVAKLLPDEPLFEEARTVADRVKAILAQTRSINGVRFDQVGCDDNFHMCKSLQKLYFEPEKRSRLDKLYRAVELLMYYYFCSKTISSSS